MCDEVQLWLCSSWPPRVGDRRWACTGTGVPDLNITPPLMYVSWRTIGLVVVIPVKGPEQVSVQDVAARDPRPLLQAIPLPVHQVLPAVAPPANVQDIPDCVGGHPVHNPNCGRVINCYVGPGALWSGQRVQQSCWGLVLSLDARGAGGDECPWVVDHTRPPEPLTEMEGVG